MTIRDVSAVERTAVWLDELIRACERRGGCYGTNPALARDVTRKAKALRTSLNKFRQCLFPNDKEDSDAS